MRILAVLAMAAMAWGQEAAPKLVHKIIQLKYVDASRASGLLGVFAQSLVVQASPQLHMIAVSGPADRVTEFEEAVKKIDVPPVDFDLTVYLISSAPSDSLPAALASTAKQLHSVFSYAGYQLLEDFVLRGRDGQRGTANGTFHGSHSTYSFRYNQASVTGDSPKTVSLHDLELGLRYRTGAVNKDGQPVFQDTGLTTDIDIREGQKVVVGKSDVNNGESPLIVVVTAKVVE